MLKNNKKERKEMNKFLCRSKKCDPDPRKCVDNRCNDFSPRPKTEFEVYLLYILKRWKE